MQISVPFTGPDPEAAVEQFRAERGLNVVVVPDDPNVLGDWPVLRMDGEAETLRAVLEEVWQMTDYDISDLYGV